LAQLQAQNLHKAQNRHKTQRCAENSGLMPIRVPACLHMGMPLHVVSKGFDPGLDACAAMVAAG